MQYVVDEKFHHPVPRIITEQNSCKQPMERGQVGTIMQT